MICVFLIEGDQSLRRVMDWILEEGGFQVVTAETTDQAAQRLGRDIKPSVIVINSDHPTEEKKEMIGALRQLCPGVKVLDLVHQGTNFFGSNADEYLSGPFHADDLLGKIRSLVGEGN